MPWIAGAVGTYEECGGIFFLLVTAPCHVQGSFVWLCQYNVSVLVLLDIVIFSSDCNLQHNIRGTKLLHLSFINGMNFVSKWGSWDIYVVWSVPSLARWRIFPKSFVFQILNMIDTTLLGPSAGLESETVHFGPITTKIQGGFHQSGAYSEPRALVQALWHGI